MLADRVAVGGWVVAVDARPLAAVRPAPVEVEHDLGWPWTVQVAQRDRLLGVVERPDQRLRWPVAGHGLVVQGRASAADLERDVRVGPHPVAVG